MKFSKDGYKENSKDKGNPYNTIKGGKITMKGVKHPIMAIPYDKDGNPMPARIMQPEQEYDFGGEVSYVMEIPYKKGGKTYQMGGDFMVQNTPAYQQMSQTVQMTPEQIMAANQINPVQNNNGYNTYFQSSPQQLKNEQFLTQLDQDVVNFDQEQQLIDAQENLQGVNQMMSQDKQLQTALQQENTNSASLQNYLSKNATDQGIYGSPETPDKTQFFNPYGG